MGGHILKISALFLVIKLNTCSIIPNITPISPFKVISGGSLEILVVNRTLTCGEKRTSVQDCITECFQRDQSGTGCPGFYTKTTAGSECHMCRVPRTQDIQGSLYTTFTAHHKVYLLASDATVPEVAMTFDDHSGETNPGKGTTGTMFSVNKEDYVVGKKGIEIIVKKCEIVKMFHHWSSVLHNLQPSARDEILNSAL